jgi:hypothetical protein
MAFTIVILAGCLSTGKSLKEPLVLEVEDFTLSQCVASEFEGASQGKGVKFEKPDSSASFETTLPPGDYKITVYVKTRGPDEDGFFVTVNDSGQTRVFYNSIYGIYGIASLVFFSVGEDKVVKILIEAGEVNMILDKVAIESVIKTK